MGVKRDAVVSVDTIRSSERMRVVNFYRIDLDWLSGVFDFNGLNGDCSQVSSLFESLAGRVAAAGSKIFFEFAPLCSQPVAHTQQLFASLHLQVRLTPFKGRREPETLKQVDNLLEQLRAAVELADLRRHISMTRC